MNVQCHRGGIGRRKGLRVLLILFTISKLKVMSAIAGNSIVESDEFRETLTGNADGNPEPSLRRSSEEGAETNG